MKAEIVHNRCVEGPVIIIDEVITVAILEPGME
jgi:hypothetical protein